jgi:hypothetical protein
LEYQWVKGDKMSELTAYEKMLKDGSAFKPIKIEQPTPDNPNGGMGRGADPDHEIDYSVFDDHMKGMIQEKIEAKKSKVNGGPERPGTQSSQQDNHRITRLEERIKLLEQALSLVMETQTKLMRG